VLYRLIEADHYTNKNILKKVEGVKFINFSGKDVARHQLVKEILSAYDDWEAKEAGL